MASHFLHVCPQRGQPAEQPLPAGGSGGSDGRARERNQACACEAEGSPWARGTSPPRRGLCGGRERRPQVLPQPPPTPNHPPLSLLPSNMPPTWFQHRPTRVKPALHQSQDSRASGNNAKQRVTAPRQGSWGPVWAPEQGGRMAGRVWWEGPARTGPAVCAGGQPAPSTPRGRTEMRGLEGGGTTERSRIRGDERTSQTSRGRSAGTALGSRPRDDAEAGTRGAGGRPSRAPESSSVLCLPF